MSAMQQDISPSGAEGQLHGSSVLESESETDLTKAGETGAQDRDLERLLDDSPFIDLQHPITAYELAKLVLMLPIVLLKLLLLIPIVLFFWVVLRLLLLGHRRQAPMHPVRRALVERWVRGGARLLLLFAGFWRIRCKGWDNMRLAQASRSVLAFNHESYCDGPAMVAFFAPSGVAKSGVAGIPFFGRFAIGLQFFFVERKGMSDKSNRFVLRKDPVAAIRERAADPRYPLVMLAPEATTKSKRCLLKFRRGAFATARPVTPVLLTYRFRHFNPGWGLCNSALHAYRLMAQLYNSLEVEVLPPVPPTAAELGDPAAFAGRVRRLMGKALGAPLVEQGVHQLRELERRGVHPNLLGTKVTVQPALLAPPAAL